MLVQISRKIHTTSASFFQTTMRVLGEPLKRKKKMDPAIVKAREDRARKRLQKEIDRLQKLAKQFKPIEENELSARVFDTKSERQRPKEPMTNERIWEEYQIMKEWKIYKTQQQFEKARNIEAMMNSSSRALEELRSESEELYQAAIQLDDKLLPYEVRGPVSTPPIENYDSPDGEYEDVSRKWL